MNGSPAVGVRGPPAPRSASERSLTGAAARGVAWTALERWIDHLVSVVVFVVLGRLLVPSAFGLVAAASLVILVLKVLVDLGFSRALVQRAEITEEHINTAFWTSVAAGAVFMVIVAAAAPLVAMVYSEPPLVNVVRALSLVFLFASLDTTQSALVERHLAFRVQAIRRLVATGVSAGVAVALAVWGAGVWALVAQALTLEAVTVTLLWRMVSWRPRWKVSKACFLDLASFGVRYSAVRVLWSLSGNVDDFLVGVVLGPVALGYYVVAYRVLVIFQELFTQTINQVTLSAYSKLQKDPGRLREIFYSSIGLVAMTGLPAYAGLALVAPQVVQLLFGAKWGPSVPVMQALALTGMIRCSGAFNHNLMLAMGKIRAELRWNSVTTALTVVAFAASVRFGILAVAVGLLSVNLVLWPVRILRLHVLAHVNVRSYVRPYVGPLAATGVMAVAVTAAGSAVAGHGNLAVLGAKLATGALTYGVTVALVAPSTTRDLLRAMRLLRNRPVASGQGHASRAVVGDDEACMIPLPARKA